MTNFNKSYFSIKNIPANLQNKEEYYLTVEVQPIIDDKATEEIECFFFAVISNGKMTQVLNLSRPEQNIIFPAINFDINNGDIIPTRLIQAEVLTSFINFEIESVYWHDNEEFFVPKVNLKKRKWQYLKFGDNIDLTALYNAVLIN